MKQILLYIALTFILGGCFERLSSLGCANSVTFDLPFYIENKKDTFNIGDTLWLVSEFDDNIKDVNSNAYYQMKDFDFQSSFLVTQIDKGKEEYVTNKFDTLAETGSIKYVIRGANDEKYVKGEAGRINFAYNYAKNKYSLRVALIPKIKGAFYFAIFNLTRNFEVEFKKNCDDYLQLNYCINEKLNNNYEVLATKPDIVSKDVSKKDFDAGGGYIFFVK